MIQTGSQTMEWPSSPHIIGLIRSCSELYPIVVNRRECAWGQHDYRSAGFTSQSQQRCPYLTCVVASMTGEDVKAGRRMKDAVNVVARSLP